MDKPIAERKPSKIFYFFLNLIILAQMDKIHWRKDTFQDFQHNIHSIHLIITYKWHFQNVGQDLATTLP